MKKVNLLTNFLIKLNVVTLGLFAPTATLIAPSNAIAATVNLSFTKLTGLTGDNPAQTAVYRAELTDIGIDISAVKISDNSSGLGGSPGQFSGFDFDGIKLSNSLTNNASDVNTITSLNVFNFSSAGTSFTPGTQRSPADRKLFGTTATGDSIDDSVATLESFDANSTTNTTPPLPIADGFVSLGDNGIVEFNLTSSVPSDSPLYLYIGEVGDNGEVAASQITVSDDNGVGELPKVPEPSFLLSLLSLGVLGTGSAINRWK
jgi:hypothetical protein